jgi:Bacterial Ig-like domain (group 3)
MLRSRVLVVMSLLAFASAVSAQAAKFGIVPLRSGFAPDLTPACSNPKLSYFGGPVVSNVQVVPVLWSSNVNSQVSSNITQFFADATVSPWFDMMSEYASAGALVSGGSAGTNQSIGRGTSVSVYTLTPSRCSSTANCTVTDAQLQNELNSQIASGNLPQPVNSSAGYPNTVYMTFFPHNVKVTGPEGSGSSCTDFCAYHNTGLLGSSTTPLLYGVVGDMFTGGCSAGCGDSVSALDNTTNVASHELAEAITDADIGLDTAAGYQNPAAWGDNSNGCGEVADICDNSGDGFTIDIEGRSWVVQQLWSQAQRKCTGTALAPHFAVAAPATTAPATAFNVSITAVNPLGTSITDKAYMGTVHFTSTDPNAALPADFTFVPEDSGVNTLSMRLTTTGSQTITATDTLNGAIVGTSAAIVVSQSATSTVLSTACPTTFTENQPITLNAMVAGANPSGSVNFDNGPDMLCNAFVASGSASCQTSPLAVQSGVTSSTYSVTADFNGDSANQPSVSQPLSLTVLAASDVVFRNAFEPSIARCPTH